LRRLGSAVAITSSHYIQGDPACSHPLAASDATYAPVRIPVRAHALIVERVRRACFAACAADRLRRARARPIRTAHPHRRNYTRRRLALQRRWLATTDSYLSSDGEQWARIAGPPHVLPVELADWVEVTAARPIGPVLSVRVDAPAKLDVTNGQYTPNPFTMVATVSNQGMEAATDVQITLTLPTGLTLVGVAPLTRISLLQPGESRQVQWSVSAAAQGQETTLTYTVAASMSGVPSRAVSRQITIPPFPFTTSYYMSTIDASAAFQKGCEVRKEGQQGIVVLNFGAPRYLGVKGFGTRLIRGQRAYVTLSQIENAVKAFAFGYQYVQICDSPPANPVAPKLVIAIGTTNSKTYPNENPTIPLADNRVLSDTYILNGIGTTSGQEWAKVVNSVNSYLGGTNAFPAIQAAGAYDAEFGVGEWSNFDLTLGWANSFSKATKAYYYAFGTCDGCPTDPQEANWNVGEKQVMEKAFKISWDVPAAVPLPQVYYGDPNQAQQWANVRWYAHQSPYNANMVFYGGMTGCLRVGCVFRNSSSWRSVPYFQELSPSQGWNALFDTINAPISPDNAINTYPQPNIRWITDIKDQ